MSKRRKHKKSDERRLARVLLITAILNLIVSMIGLIQIILSIRLVGEENLPLQKG